MTIAAPVVDSRNADDVAAQLKRLLRDYAPDYKGAGSDPITGELVPDSRGAALIGIFARFAELIIERLNRVPDKNQLAFFDLLGASRLPPQPSRVPLTFSLAKGSASPGVVPPGTQVASPPGEGETAPVIFETERELVVTPAVLTAVFARDPDVDAYADLGAIVSGTRAQGSRVFRGERIIEHSAYFGQRQLLGFNGITSFKVSVGLAAALNSERTVSWEAWNGTTFKEIVSRVEDSTDNLRTSGSVDLGPVDPVPLSTIQGIESRWLRCRFRRIINISDVDRQQMVRADDLPVIESVTNAVSVSRDDLAIDSAFTNASPIDATKDFFPFGETPRFGDTFFLRADEPFSTAGATVRIHVTLTNPNGSGSVNPVEVRNNDVTLIWEAGNGSAWIPLGTSKPALTRVVSDVSDTIAVTSFSDGTAALTRSGDVEFVCPQNVSRTIVNGIDGYWIRARITGGDYGHEARYVKGADAVTSVLDARGQTKQAFVRWHETADFYASGPRDRHYVVDRFTGEIRFGDGLKGLVPPPGIGNIRLAWYQTGGGRAGNRAAGSIAQLKTTVPYVDKVTNHEPASGGADAEPLDALLDRAPREIRHGGRAVTIEDYEDVALLASPEVARAKCVPLADLLVDALEPAPSAAGDVSVIVVPRSTDVKPLPSVELIRRVRDFLDGVHDPTVRLSVVGPLYVRVDVTAEIGLVSIDHATDVVADVRQKVAGFLHPLTGGLDGRGWDFGRRPHLSDLYALIEAIPGVDHIRALDVAEVEDVAGVTPTGRFLVYSGEPAISVVLENA